MGQNATSIRVRQRSPLRIRFFSQVLYVREVSTGGREYRIARTEFHLRQLLRAGEYTLRSN